MQTLDDVSTLKAITVHRPWGYAIARLGKDIENRTWKCSLKPGELIAIHNGKAWDESAKRFIKRVTAELVYATPAGGNPKGAIIAVARFTGNVAASDSPWFAGPIGWGLSDVVRIDPVYCLGRQGLWKIDDATMIEVRKGHQKGLINRHFDKETPIGTGDVVKIIPPGGVSGKIGRVWQISGRGIHVRVALPDPEMPDFLGVFQACDLQRLTGMLL